MAIDLFQADEIVSRTNVNQRLTDIKDMFPVSIANGGTGGTTATLARTNLGVMSPTELYYNASGTSGTVVLSESIANYTVIEVFAFNTDNLNTSITIWNNGAGSCDTTIITDTPYIMNNEHRMSIITSKITISGTSITFGDQTYATIRPSWGGSVGNGAGYSKIYKVVGYKY